MRRRGAILCAELLLLLCLLGGLASLTITRHRTELWSYSGERLLFVARMTSDGLVLYAVHPGTGGLGRDERSLRFLGFVYRSAYEPRDPNLRRLGFREMVGRQKIAVFADSSDKQITPKQRDDWSKGTPVQWADESHRVAIEKVYAGVPEDGPPPKLGPEYVAKRAPVVAEQLERAGIRLARVLNAAFVGSQ